MIAADGNKTVGKLHDKSCRAKADNIFGITKTAAKLPFSQKAHLKFSPPCQKMTDKCGG